jgi:hypothetical protein
VHWTTHIYLQKNRWAALDYTYLSSEEQVGCALDYTVSLAYLSSAKTRKNTEN